MHSSDGMATTSSQSIPPRDDAQTFALIGAAMDVHREVGCGFHEPVYRAAYAIELRRRGIPFVAEAGYTIAYKGEMLPLLYRVDFLCFGEVIVEIKALSGLGSSELAHVINYLRASGLQRGLLINFGARSLEHRRVVQSRIQTP